MRLRKSLIGHFLYLLSPNNRINIEIPSINVFLAYTSNNKTVLFDFDKNQNPIRVYQGNIESNNWVEENYIGLPIIIVYSKEEYYKKHDLIKKALQQQWSELNKNKKSYILHGDFTHLNILFTPKNEIIAIDNKSIQNSLLYDHFYFYSYLCQCLELCTTLNNTHTSEIIIQIGKTIKTICVFNSLEELGEAVNAITLSDATGLLDADDSLKRFKTLMLED